MIKKIFFYIFMILQIALFSVLVFDAITNKINGNISELIRISLAIVYCLFMLSMMSKFSYKSVLIGCSGICVLFADYFLIYEIDEHQLLGIGFFVLVQIIYQFIINSSYKMNFIHIFSSSIVALIVVAILEEPLNLDFELSLAALAYFICSIFNLVNGIIVYSKNKTLNKNWIFLISILLLLLCDLCLGLDNISSSSVFSRLVYVFYAPSLIMNGIYAYRINLDTSSLFKDKEVTVCK